MMFWLETFLLYCYPTSFRFLESSIIKKILRRGRRPRCRGVGTRNVQGVSPRTLYSTLRRQQSVPTYFTDLSKRQETVNKSTLTSYNGPLDRCSSSSVRRRSSARVARSIIWLNYAHSSCLRKFKTSSMIRSPGHLLLLELEPGDLFSAVTEGVSPPHYQTSPALLACGGATT